MKICNERKKDDSLALVLTKESSFKSLYSREGSSTLKYLTLVVSSSAIF